MAAQGHLPIRIGAVSFDPTEQPPDEDMRRLRQGDASTARVIVQLHKPLTREDQAQLRGRYGLRLADYVPEQAYVEGVPIQMLDLLAADPAVRAIVPFRPEFKVSPTIGERAFRTRERQNVAGLLLEAILFPDAEPDTVARALGELGATSLVVLDDRELGGPAKVRFVLDSALRLPEIALLDDLRWIEEVGEVKLDNGTTAGTIQSGTPSTTPVWGQQLHGEGQIIGVLDTGVDMGHCFFRDDTDNTIRPAHRKMVGFRNTSGGANDAHGTFVAGIAAGDDSTNPGGHVNRGMAWAARLTFGNTGDLATNSLLSYLQAAAADGACIHTNSWHDEPTPQYSQVAADVDNFVWNNEDHLVVGSSGNVGESIGPPGTSKNAICVSATMRDPNEMSFGDGNNGPTPDGRRKPELMAPGCTITSAAVNTPCTVDVDANIFGFGPICATSWATPAVAGAAALVRQYYTEGFYPTGTAQPHHAFVPSGALIKATLLNSTIDMTGITGYPGNQEGWGIIRLDNVLWFPGAARNVRLWDTRNVDGLHTGETATHHVDVAGNTQALRIALVWSDPPAAAGSAMPTVNNLDLEVVSPDGSQTFRGNVFSGGVSATGGTADALNNVEMVVVSSPAAGDWTVRVVATGVNVGNPGQGYALVATADLTEPPVSTGIQDTLVVRVRFSDVAIDPPLANLQNLLADAAAYIDEISYGQATVVPALRGPIQLDHPRSYYYHPDRSLLIELTEEVVAKLVLAEPTAFDTIERLVIVTNDVNFIEDRGSPWVL